MQFQPTELPGVCLVEQRIYEDARGYFMETYHRSRFREAGIDVDFIQDNHSRSRRGTLRGLHYQLEHPQAKLVRVVQGEIFDVVVDLRRKSACFGRWAAVRLSAENCRQLFIPVGCAHGFCALTEPAEIVYQCSDYYYPDDEHTLLWNDPAVDIAWPIQQPILSEKDRFGLPLAQLEVYERLCAPG